MPSQFLGKGWKFPPGPTDTGEKIAEARYEESIRDAIWIILGTAQGERVMRPNFGCGIHDLVFEPNDAGTIGRIASEVSQALLKWEPRITVKNIQVSPGKNGELLINIAYQVRSTNNRFNLVYPFYLDRSVSG